MRRVHRPGTRSGAYASSLEVWALLVGFGAGDRCGPARGTGAGGGRARSASTVHHPYRQSQLAPPSNGPPIRCPPVNVTATVRCRIAAADTVHCVRLGTSCEAAATADFEAYLAALGLATPALLASSPSAAAVDAPIRFVRTACALRAHCVRTACTLCAHCVDPTYTYSSSSSEIRQLLGTTLGAHTRLADVRVLLLPSLAASLVSASATALPPTENHALCRALATPSVALQQRGAAEQRELPAAHPAPHPTAHPPLEHVLVVSMPGTTRWRGGPEATESLAAAAAALVQARELQGVDHTLTKAYTYCGCTYYD